MKKLKTFSSLLFALLLWSESFADQVVRIACIGNSITYGSNISDREKNCYPSQLQEYLGKHYEVRNFGVSGCTALTKGDRPYIRTTAYQASLDFKPDIVLIKLGTNDSKPRNWKYNAEFATDYQALVDSYRNQHPGPRIILLTPIRCFLPVGSEINAQIIAQHIRPQIEKIAYENKLEIINLFNLFGDQWQSHLLPDKLHPSAIGAGIMAQKIYEYLTGPTALAPKKIKQKLGLSKAKEFNFHGYQGYEFTNDGVRCFIVSPARETPDKRWVIRARFWNHEPQTDIALLEQGFHITYCDVANLYGAPSAVARWNSFYKRMRKAGFHKEVVLEGMSRGGLIAYNWAARNPEKVACIYADAPVMDIKSWPLGKGKSKGSPQDARQLFTAYGFRNETEALEWKYNPLDNAALIAKAKIPVLHVVGDADQIVPVSENTNIFEQRMKELKAPITVLHKPGGDHHPHSFNNPEPIVRFILKATGMNRNRCTHAVPGNEFRSGAGWTRGSDWHSIAGEITTILQGKQLKLLLLGNSITQGWGGNRPSITHCPGQQAMNEVLGNNTWESAGISGDRTQNLLWRIRFGNYNASHPENIVIAIGINNLLGGNDTAEEVAEGITAVSKEVRKQFPDSRIILLGPLPAGKEKKSPIRLQCDKIHDILAATKIKGVEYTNPTSWFTESNGSIKSGLYIGDYIHLTDKGYKIWATQIAKLIRPQ